ncbi:MAG: YciI family protein, partial [Myxococcota bacterium]
MQYVLLIHEDEQLWENLTEPEADETMAGYARFGELLAKGDHMRGGERLRPTETATTVRVRDDEVLLSDGPFAETKEQLGGFYLVEAADLDG